MIAFLILSLLVLLSLIGLSQRKTLCFYKEDNKCGYCCGLGEIVVPGEFKV